MARSTTSRKLPKTKPAAADEAEPFGAPVGEIVASLDAEDPEDFAADLIRAVLKWQIEQIQMNPSKTTKQAGLRARDARTMTELVRTMEKLDAVEKRREGRGRKSKSRDDKAIKENFVRRLDQLLAARGEGGVSAKPQRG